MTYQAISRKYRPQRFEEVVGQSHICLTLQNAIKNDRVSHAYLFSGSRGIGKTSTARILAKSLNCKDPEEYNPCGKCQNCLEITAGRSMDVLEIDGASNRGIDQIRDLRENVKYPPANSNYRIYIIDEVHMLTKEAFNALLKTLEEPPKHIVFIFATTEPSKIPATIISRCQRYDFYRISVHEIVEQLKNVAKKESVIVPDEVFMLIAKKASGSMRDAESLMDQVIAFSGNTVKIEDAHTILGLIDYDYYFRISDMVISKDNAGLLKIAHEIFDNGIDVGEFLNGLSDHFRNFIIANTTKSVSMLDLTPNVKENYEKKAEEWQTGDLLRFHKIITDAQVQLKFALNQRTFLEFILLKLGTMDNTVTVQSLLESLDKITNLPISRAPSKAKTLDIFDTDTNIPNKNLNDNPQLVKERTSSSKGRIEYVSNSSDGLSIGKIRKNWNRVVQKVEETNPSLSNFLKDGLPHQIKGKVLEVAFNRKSEFHIRNINSRAQIVEKAISEIFNDELRIKCIRSEDDSVSMPDTKALDSITKTLVDIFDGEVISR